MASVEDSGEMSAHDTVCPECGSRDLLSITMQVDGRDLSFTTCHGCEAKWWDRDGEAVPLTSVINIVAQR